LSDNPLGYKPPAAETEEGKARLQEHWTALGKFIDRFTKAEIAVALTLWHYAKMKHDFARIAFGGTNLETACGMIKKLAAASERSKETQEDLTFLLDHLGVIRGARNDILHYGAIDIAEGNASVTNAIKAITQDRIYYFPISAKILENMSADLRKIIVRLTIDHMGRRRPSERTIETMFSETMRNTWRYKHQTHKPKQTRSGEGQTSPAPSPK